VMTATAKAAVTPAVMTVAMMAARAADASAP
jgi:hypothetical protein